MEMYPSYLICVADNQEKSHQYRTMNMKSIPSWLLVFCIVIGQLLLTTEGADLQWENSVSIINGNWQFKLLNVPSRGFTRWDVTLYQQLPGGNLDEIKTWKSEDVYVISKQVPTKMDIPFLIGGSAFKGDTKIVKATVRYPDGEALESTTFDINQFVGMVVLIVGLVIGGVCLIAVVVGCILCNKRRRRRVPFQQPAAVVGQTQVCHTTQAPVMVQGQNYQVPQAGTQNQYV